jgi:thiamine-monophosphate kinase
LTQPGTPGEFDLIAMIRSRAAAGSARRQDVLLGIGDDAAVLALPAGQCLVVATDTLNDGVHFPAETAAADVGWKALAVNLSDLAAMGAQPAWATLSLSLREADPAWVDGFLDGFLSLASEHGVALVGGDTTRGPLSVCVTVHGFVACDGALRRDGAQAGDDIWVTGTLGDAAGALSQWRAGGAAEPALRQRMDRPQPRVAAGRALAGVAHACIDISDGLLADLGHVCNASGVGARVDLESLPASAALQALFTPESRRTLQAAGGDDYELCFTAPPSQRAAVMAIAARCALSMTRIGQVGGGEGVALLDRAGIAWRPPRGGYDHFGGN